VIGPPQPSEREHQAIASVGDWLIDQVPWLDQQLLGNELWRGLALLLTLAAALAVHRLLKRRVIGALRRVSARTRTPIDDIIVDAIDAPLSYLIAITGLFVASRWLILPTAVQDPLWSLYRIAAVSCLGWVFLRGASELTQLFARRARETASQLDDSIVPLIGQVARMTIIVILLVLVLRELGFDVSGIVTGLGVGGLAFALAAKDTLANWFGALMIFTDHPFDIGHWIKTSTLEGVVEEIGMRSTRVRTFAKTVVSVPNSALANDVVENLSRMPMRRVYFTLGVTYATTPAMMRESVARIEEILKKHPQVDQELIMVKFTDFGDSSLNILIYYFTTTTKWAEFLTIRGEINLAIMEALGEIGVSVAFPSRSIYFDKGGEAEREQLDARARELLAARAAAPAPAPSPT
jgi:MscS family membrane protein